MAKYRKTINDKLTIIGPDKHYGGHGKTISHDPTAIACFEKVIEVYKPGHVVDLGDMIDNQPFSRWGPTTMQSATDYDWGEYEIKPAKAHIDRVCNYTNHFSALLGNHDFWVERKCLEWGIAGQALWSEVNPRKVLYGDYSTADVTVVNYVNDHDITACLRLAPNLLAIHGWTACKGAAEKHLEKAVKAGCSVIYGHTHRIQTATTRQPFTDEVFQSWSPGCLRSLRPAYSQSNGPTDWAHGFSMIYKSSRNPRNWTAYTPIINNGSVVTPDGTEVRV